MTGEPIQETAHAFHAGFALALIASGWDVVTDVPVTYDVQGEPVGGSIDIVATRGEETLAIEIEEERPRRRSAVKLMAFPATRRMVALSSGKILELAEDGHVRRETVVLTAAMQREARARLAPKPQEARTYGNEPGEPADHGHLVVVVGRALRDADDFAAFIRILQESGISVATNVSRQAHKLNGMRFGYKTASVKGAALGVTPTKLGASGIPFEWDRHGALAESLMPGGGREPASVAAK